MYQRQRIISIFLCLSITFMFSKGGFLMLNTHFGEKAKNKNQYRITVSEIKGNIYDRNGEKLVNDTEENTLIIKPTDKSILHLKNELSTEDFLKIQKDLLKGRPTVLTIDDAIAPQEDILQIKTFTRYSEMNLLRHIIGYLDMNGNGVCGIEKSYNEILCQGTRKITAEFSVSAMNTVLTGEDVKIFENDYYSKSGVKLTVDRDIQMICEETADLYDILKGVVVVLDAKTAEILAIVSRPTYDVTDLEKSLENRQSPMINRALSAYPTGSIFKLITAAAAIEEDYFPQYCCSGEVKIGDTIFNCHKDDGHGVVDLEEALAQSCNTYFIRVAEKIGSRKILNIADKTGFGKRIFLCEGIFSDAGYLPQIDEIDSDGKLANLSFGQGTLISTPLQIAAMTSAVANSGNYTNPSLISGIIDDDGNTQENAKEAPNRALSEKVCDLLTKAMISALEKGTGKKAKPINTSAAVKTSTAENSDGTYNSWLTGFFPSDEPEYVVTILKEDGISGGEDCGPVFKRIAEKITLLSR